MNKLFAAILLAGLPVLSQAQPLTDTLGEVQVRGRRPERQSADARLRLFSPGMQQHQIDSQTLARYQQQHMATLISEQLPVFVRSYGFNSLATLSFRGASPAQSQVLWNGVPLQHASSGVADISLLPVALHDQVRVVYGSSAALWGSGNIGGALLLEHNQATFDSVVRRSAKLSGGLASFSQYQAGLQLSQSSRRWYLSLQAFGQSGRNDFPFLQHDTLRRMPNAHILGGSVQMRLARRLGARHQLSLTSWLQHYERQIPPALFESYVQRRQTDAAMRFLLEWNHQSRSGSRWHNRLAYIQDMLRYEDEQLMLRAFNPGHQVFQEVGWQKATGPHAQLLLMAPVQLAWMQTPDSGFQAQYRAALAAAYKMDVAEHALQLSFNARLEQADKRGILLPGLNASWQWKPWLAFKANVQRTYRLPSLQELYYKPGGNPSLKPEEGWSADAGYSLKFRPAQRLELKQEVSIFGRWIENWILWFGGSVWTPHNVSAVFSRGLESTQQLRWQRGRAAFEFSLATSYILSTTQKSLMPHDNSLGRQIPYAPRYQGRAQARLLLAGWLLAYGHSYTGYRFITTDESQYLEPFNTGMLQLQWQGRAGGRSFQLHGQLSNIWNARYQVVAGRAMPGRYAQLGFGMQL